MERLPNIQRGDEVLVGGEWYPVSGYSLSHAAAIPPITGSVFTSKPHGTFEPCLGYRIDYARIEKIRRPESV